MNDGANGPNESRRAFVAPEKTRITLAVPLPVADDDVGLAVAVHVAGGDRDAARERRRERA